MKNAQLTCIAPLGSEPARIVIEGELTIRNAAAVLEVDLDLAFVQVLLALRKTAGITEKKMTIELDVCEDLSVLLKRSGLYDLIALK